MDEAYPKEGFYDLTAADLFGLACKQYEAFYHDQTPLNAYQVSVTLFHLLDWLAKDGSTRNGRNAIEEKTEGDRSAEEALVLRIYALDDFRAVMSAANNAKHRELDGKSRPAYAKKRRRGAYAGVMRAGDSMNAEHLILVVGEQEVWLRDAFHNVLQEYRTYFGGGGAEDKEEVAQTV